MFAPGDRVICVDNGRYRSLLWGRVPQKPSVGSVYCVRDVCNDQTIRLVEIVNPQIACEHAITHEPMGDVEPSFFAKDFLPHAPEMKAMG